MKIGFSSDQFGAADIVIVPVFDGGRLESAGAAIDSELGGLLARQIDHAPNFSGKTGEVLSLPLPGHGKAKQVIMLGCGKPGALSEKTVRALAAPLVKTLETSGYKSARMLADDISDLAAPLADALVRASYRFDKYKTDANSKSRLETVDFSVADQAAAAKAYDRLAKVTEGLHWARNLGNEPANILYPDSYAKQIRDTLTPLGVKVTILDEREMEALGMNAALAVGKGSDNPPRMVVMEYDGTNGRQDKPLGLVGKGITFDSGGISIKPSGGMEEMKMDMGGSAAVVGVMMALAGRKAKIKVAAIVGLAENMPSGKAARPGDIVKSMAGKTIEIVNTDAEGRLVLADAMTYLQQEFDPHTLIDLATLTGAVVVTTHDIYTGGFSNNDALYAKIEQAGKEAGDEFWRMPLHEKFAQAVKGKDADLTNSAPMRWGGASTAAEFLHNFVTSDENGNERPWAHLDIAGSAMTARGATGRPVAALERLIADHFEEKDGPAPAPFSAPAPKP